MQRNQVAAPGWHPRQVFASIDKHSPQAGYAIRASASTWMDFLILVLFCEGGTADDATDRGRRRRRRRRKRSRVLNHWRWRYLAGQLLQIPQERPSTGVDR